MHSKIGRSRFLKSLFSARTSLFIHHNNLFKSQIDPNDWLLQFRTGIQSVQTRTPPTCAQLQQFNFVVVKQRRNLLFGFRRPRINIYRSSMWLDIYESLHLCSECDRNWLVVLEYWRKTIDSRRTEFIKRFVAISRGRRCLRGCLPLFQHKNPLREGTEIPWDPFTRGQTNPTGKLVPIFTVSRHLSSVQSVLWPCLLRRDRKV